MKRQNGKQIAPCIVAWARYALGIRTTPDNNKNCSIGYWEETIDLLLINYQDKIYNKQSAIENFCYVSKRYKDEKGIN